MSGTDGRPSLKQRFLGSVAWTSLGQAITSFLGIGVTVTLARLLDPQDFGLLAMATVFTRLVVQAQDFGVGQALVQSETAKPEQQKATFLLVLGFSSGLYVAMFLLAVPIAAFYDDARVVNIVRVLALTYPISSFSVVPSAMLRRNLRMRGEAITSTISMLMEATTSISLAWFGFGVWALVVGQIVSGVSRAIGLSFASPWRPGFRIHGGGGLSLLRFGGGVTTSTYLWYAYSNLDFLIIGRVLGSATLGVYTMAWNLAKMPQERIWSAVNPLILPILARTRSNRAELGRVVCKITRFTALIAFPAAAGLGAVAVDVVRVVLSDKWEGAVRPLQWLCVYGVVRSVVVLMPSVLVAVGELRRLIYFHLICLLALPTGFILGLRLGPSGVAMAWAIVYPLVAAVWLLPPALRAAEIPVRLYLLGLARPAAATATMVGVVALAGAVLPFHGVVRLVLRVSIGAAVYLLCIRLLEGPILSEFRSLYRDGFKGLRAG